MRMHGILLFALAGSCIEALKAKLLSSIRAVEKEEQCRSHFQRTFHLRNDNAHIHPTSTRQIKKQMQAHLVGTLRTPSENVRTCVTIKSLWQTSH